MAFLSLSRQEFAALLLTDLTHAIKGAAGNLYTIAHKKSTPKTQYRDHRALAKP